MMSSSTTTAANGRSKFPFTATQWQELEHQALFYKYMTAGIPIPPDLLFSIKRSLDSSLSSKLFPYHTPSPLGWNPYQMGYGKKIDPEPGRCRRTDGKKWRCSKEAFPDSKYCERHMHRGKNRSRKPVENPPLTPLVVSTTTTTTSTPTFSTSSSTLPSNFTHQSLLATNKNYPPCSSSSSVVAANNNPNSLYSFDSPSYNNPNTTSHLLYNKDYRERYFHGFKEEVGEHAFLTESSASNMRGFSGSSIDENWPLSGAKTHANNNNYCDLQQSGYPINYLGQLQGTNNGNDGNGSSTKQCYIWGRDFNCELSMKLDDEKTDEKTTHHFFDEWPIKEGGDGNGVRDSSWHDSSSTTQLSISIPSSTSSHHDFFLSNSRIHNDG